MSRSTTPIELGREFFPVSTTGLPEIPEDFTADFFRLSKQAKTWHDLRDLWCVVVLGEAGTGKTTELRARAITLQREGRAAFFLPVEDISQLGVEGALTREDRHRFASWQKDSTAEAWFMLDSVDEALLKGTPLRAALRRFERELDAHLHRIHIVLSSRASDWRSTDAGEVQLLAQYLGREASHDETKTPRPPPALVQLAPLNESQISKLAAHHGVNDTARFLAEVRAMNAWLFLERPRDVEWLARYWQEHRRIGNLSELIHSNVRERLKEKQDRKSVLSLDQAHEAAQLLALVACLTQNGSFRLPDEVVDLKAQEALDPRDVLTDFTGDQIRDLLARGLFDEATYGRVRIHHRSVREYLAAQKLLQLVENGLSTRELERLLFCKNSGKVVVPRHLVPIVAWLSASNSDVRRKAIEVAPEYLIDEGDPAALSAEARRLTLSAYARRFGAHEHVFHSIDTYGLRRFACNELCQTIREVMADATITDHMRIMLLRLIEKGKLSGLVEVARGIALSETTPSHVRMVAIRSVVAAGDSTDRSALAALTNHSSIRERDVLGELLDHLFPADIPVSAVVELLVATNPVPRLTATRLDVVLPRLPDRCTGADRLQFFADLLAAMQVPMPTATTRPIEVRDDRVWLAECLSSLVTQLVSDGAPCDTRLLDSLELLEDVETHPERPPNDRLRTILAQYPHLRREVFWRKVSRMVANEKKFPRGAWQTAFLGSLRPTTNDMNWFRGDCITRLDVRERLLAFDWFNELLRQSSSPDRWDILAAVADESDRQHERKGLVQRLKRMRNPPHYAPPDYYNQMELRERVQRVHQRNLHNRNHEGLRARLPGIRTGQEIRALWHLYSLRGADTWHGLISRKAIADKYDDEIAVAALLGVKSVWRSHAPIPPESYAPNETPGLCMLGLAGLALEDEEDVEISSLPEPLLRNAIVYAMWELNGFPDWFSRCVEARPDLVGELFAPSLRLDYDAQPRLGRILPKLTSAPLALRRACAPCLIELVRDHEAPDVEVLHRVLRVLRSSEVMSATDFAALAQARTIAATNEPQRCATWWCSWLSCDADSSIGFLEKWFESASDAAEMAEEVFSQLWRTHDEGESFGYQMDRQALVRLIPLVYTHVDSQNDISDDREFSQRRDYAENLRHSIVRWLAEIEGEETVDALKLLAKQPQLPRFWLLHLAEERIVANVAKERMSVTAAMHLIRSVVVEPRNTDELFEICLERLDDIQYDLKYGDFSYKDLFNPQPKAKKDDERIVEEPVQQFIARELDNRRRTQYTVVREPEVVRKNKPDIRMSHPRCSGPVTIEVKIAERWSLNELEEALQSQLVDKYMKANDSRYGVLVLCSSGPLKDFREASSAPMLDFGELIERLRHLAQDIAMRNRHIRRLCVVPIDFH